MSEEKTKKGFPVIIEVILFLVLSSLLAIPLAGMLGDELFSSILKGNGILLGFAIGFSTGLLFIFAICMLAMPVVAQDLCDSSDTVCVPLNGRVIHHLETMKENGNYSLKVVDYNGNIVKVLPYGKQKDYMYKQFMNGTNMIVADQMWRYYSLQDAWQKYDPVKEY